MSATQTLGAVFTAQIENFLAGIRKVRSELMSLEGQVGRINQSFINANKGFDTIAAGIKKVTNEYKGAVAETVQAHSRYDQAWKSMLRSGNEYSQAFAQLTKNLKDHEAVVKNIGEGSKRLFTDSAYGKFAEAIKTVGSALSGTRAAYMNFLDSTVKLQAGSKTLSQELAQVAVNAQNLTKLSREQLAGVLTGTSQSVTEYLSKLKEATPLFQAFATGNQALADKINMLIPALNSGKMSVEDFNKAVSTLIKLSESGKTQPLIDAQNQGAKIINDVNGKISEQISLWGKLIDRAKEYGKFVISSTMVYAVVNSLREAFAEIVNFDQALKNLSAITLTDNFAEIIVSMKEMVVIAKNTKFSLVEISEGMVLTAQAGFNVIQSLEMINAEAILASATLSDLATAADLITTTLVSFGKTASEAMRVTDVMANAINLSKLTLEKLRIAFNYIGVSASQAGVKLEETAASFALFANAGLRASTIGTSFRQIMSELLDPTDKIRTTFELMGVPIDKLNPKIEGFRETLRTIASVLIDTEATLKNHGKYVVDMAKAYDLFQLRGSQGAAIIAKAFATGDYDAMLKMISNVGTAMEMQIRQMEGLGSKLKNLGDVFKVVAVHIGEAGLGGAIRLTIDSLRGMLNLLDAFIQTGAGQFIIQTGLMAAAIKTLAAAMTLVMIPAMTALVSSIGSLLIQMAALAANSPVILAAVTKVFDVVMALGPKLASLGALITKTPGIFMLITGAVVATGIAIVEFSARAKKAAEDFSVAATEYGRNVEALNNMQINASELFKTGDIEHYQQTLKAFTQQYPELVARIKESADVADIASLSFDQLQEAIKKLINTEFENQITANIRAMEKLDEVAQKAVQKYEKYKEDAKDDSPFTLKFDFGGQEGAVKKLKEAQKLYKNSVDETVNSLIEYKKRMNLSEKGLREYISTLKITPFEAAKVAAAVSAELRKIEEASKIDVGLIKFQSYFQELPMEFRAMYEQMDAVQKTEFLSFQKTLAQKVSEFRASAKQNYITEEEVQKSIAALKANEYAEWMIKNNDRLKATQDTEQATIDILRSFIDKSLSEFRRGNISRMQAEGEVAGYTREINEQYVGGLKKAYESAKSLTEGYVNTLNTRMNDIRSKIASLNKDITESDKSYHEDIRDLRQKTMSDEQKWLDDRAEANRLLQEGMSSQNVEMLKQSQQIFKSLARTVNDENGKAIAGVDDTVKVAQQGVEASHKAAVEAMQRQRAEFAQNMGDIQTQIVNVEARLEMYRKKIEEVSSTPFQLNTTRLEETFTELTGFVGRFKDALKKEEMELNIRFTGEGSDKKLITEKTEEVEKEVSDVIEKLDGKEATVRVAVETDKSAEVPTSSESTVSVKAIVDDSEIRKLPETVESVSDIISSPVVSTRFEAFEPGLQPVSFSQKVQNIKNEIAGLSSLLHGAYNIFRVSFIGSPGEKSLAETALNAVNTVRDSSRIINEQTAIFRTAFLSGDDSELSDKAQETIDLFQDTRSRVEGMASVFKTSFIDDSDKPISKGIADLIVQSGYLSNHINKLKTNYQVLISDETGVPVTTKLRDLPGAFAQTAGAIGSVAPVFTTNFLADDGTPLISKLTNVVTGVQRVASLISGISAIFGVNFIGRASSALPLSEKIEEIHKKITGFASVISRTVTTFTTRFITGEGSPLSEGIEWIQEKIGRLAHLIANFSPAFILRFVGNVADNLSVSDSVDRIWEKIKGFITFITTSTAVFTTQIMSGNIPFGEYLETAREKLSGFISFISSVTASVTVGISDFYSNLPIADTLDTLKEKFQTFTEFIKNLLPEFVIRFFGEASDSLPLSEKIEEVLDKIKNVAEWLTKNVATFTTRFMSDLDLPVDEAVEWVQDKIKGFISFISGLKSLIKIWFISGDDDTNIFSKIFSITKEFKNLGNIISALGPIFKVWFKARGVKEDLKDGVEETKGMFSRLTSFIAGKATDFVVNFIGRGSSAKSLSEKVEEMKDRVTGFGENIADAIPKVNLDFTGIMPAMKAVFDYLIQAVSGMKGSLGGFGDDFLDKIISLKENMIGAFDDINNALQTRAEIVEKGYMSFFDRMLGKIKEFGKAAVAESKEFIESAKTLSSQTFAAVNIFKAVFIGDKKNNEEPIIDKIKKIWSVVKTTSNNIRTLKTNFEVAITDVNGDNLSEEGIKIKKNLQNVSSAIHNIKTYFRTIFVADDDIPIDVAVSGLWGNIKNLVTNISSARANFLLSFQDKNGIPIEDRFTELKFDAKDTSEYISKLITVFSTGFLSNGGLDTTDAIGGILSSFLSLSETINDTATSANILFKGKVNPEGPLPVIIEFVKNSLKNLSSYIGKLPTFFKTEFTDENGFSLSKTIKFFRTQIDTLSGSIKKNSPSFITKFIDESGGTLSSAFGTAMTKFTKFSTSVKNLKTLFNIKFLSDSGLTIEQKTEILKKKIELISKLVNKSVINLKMKFSDEKGNFSFEKMIEYVKNQITGIYKWVKSKVLKLSFGITGEGGITLEKITGFFKQISDYFKKNKSKFSIDFITGEGTPLTKFLKWLIDAITDVVVIIGKSVAKFTVNIADKAGIPVKDAFNSVMEAGEKTASSLRGMAAIYKVAITDGENSSLWEKIKTIGGSFQKITDTVNGLKAYYRIAVTSDEAGIPIPEKIKGIVKVLKSIENLSAKVKIFFTGHGSDEKPLSEKITEIEKETEGLKKGAEKTSPKVNFEFVSGQKPLGEYYKDLTNKHNGLLKRVNTGLAMCRIAFTGTDGLEEGVAAVPVSKQAKLVVENLSMVKDKIDKSRTFFKIILGTGENRSFKQEVDASIDTVRDVSKILNSINSYYRLTLRPEDEEGNALKDFSDIVKRVNDTKEKVEAVKGNISYFFTDGYGSPIADTFDWIKKTSADVAEKIGENEIVYNFVTDIKSTTFEERWDDVLRQSKKTSGIINSLITQFKVDFLSDQKKPISEAVLNSGYLIRRLAEEIYHTSARFVIAIIGDKGKDILSYLNEKYDAVTSWIANVKDKFVQGTKNFIVKITGPNNTPLADSLNGTVDIIDIATTRMSKLFNEAVGAMLLKYDLKNSFAVTLEKQFDSLSKKTSATITDVKNSAVAIGQSIIGIGVTYKGLAFYFESTINFIKSLIKELWRLKSVFSTVFKFVLENISKLKMSFTAFTAFLLGWDLGKFINQMDLFGLLPVKIGDAVSESMVVIDKFIRLLLPESFEEGALEALTVMAEVFNDGINLINDIFAWAFGGIWEQIKIIFKTWSFTEWWNYVSEGFSNTVDIIGKSWTGLFSYISEKINRVKDALPDFIKGWLGVGKAAEEAGKGIAGVKEASDKIDPEVNIKFTGEGSDKKLISEKTKEVKKDITDLVSGVHPLKVITDFVSGDGKPTEKQASEIKEGLTELFGTVKDKTVNFTTRFIDSAGNVITDTIQNIRTLIKELADFISGISPELKIIFDKTGLDKLWIDIKGFLNDKKDSLSINIGKPEWIENPYVIFSGLVSEIDNSTVKIKNFSAAVKMILTGEIPGYIDPITKKMTEFNDVLSKLNFDKISAGFKDISGATANNFFGTFSEYSKKIELDINHTIQAIRNLDQITNKTFAGVATDFTKGISDAVSVVSHEFAHSIEDSLINLKINASLGIGNALSETNKDLLALLDKAKTAYNEGLFNGFQNIKVATEYMKTNFHEFFAESYALFIQGKKDLMDPSMLTFFEKLHETVKPVELKIDDASYKEFIEKIQTVSKEIDNAGKTSVISSWFNFDSVKNEFNSITGWIGKEAAGIKDKLKAIFIFEFVGTGSETKPIFEKIADIWAKITEFIEKIKGIVIPPITVVFDSFIEGFTTQFNLLLVSVEEEWNKLKTVLSGKWTELKSDLDDLQLIFDVRFGNTEAITATVNQWKSEISGAFGLIQSGLEGQLSQKSRDMLDMIQKTSDVINGIVSFFTIRVTGESPDRRPIDEEVSWVLDNLVKPVLEKFMPVIKFAIDKAKIITEIDVFIGEITGKISNSFNFVINFDYSGVMDKVTGFISEVKKNLSDKFELVIGFSPGDISDKVKKELADIKNQMSGISFSFISDTVNFDELKKTYDSVKNTLKEGLQVAFNFIGNTDTFNILYDSYIKTRNALAEGIKSEIIFNGDTGLFDKLGKNFQSAYKTIQTGLKTTFEYKGDFSVFETIRKGFTNTYNTIQGGLKLFFDFTGDLTPLENLQTLYSSLKNTFTSALEIIFRFIGDLNIFDTLQKAYNTTSAIIKQGLEITFKFAGDADLLKIDKLKEIYKDVADKIGKGLQIVFHFTEKAEIFTAVETFYNKVRDIIKEGIEFVIKLKEDNTILLRVETFYNEAKGKIKDGIVYIARFFQETDIIGSVGKLYTDAVTIVKNGIVFSVQLTENIITEVKRIYDTAKSEISGGIEYVGKFITESDFYKKISDVYIKAGEKIISGIEYVGKFITESDFYKKIEELLIGAKTKVAEGIVYIGKFIEDSSFFKFLHDLYVRARNAVTEGISFIGKFIEESEFFNRLGSLYTRAKDTVKEGIEITVNFMEQAVIDTLNTVLKELQVILDKTPLKAAITVDGSSLAGTVSSNIPSVAAGSEDSAQGVLKTVKELTEAEKILAELEKTLNTKLLPEQIALIRDLNLKASELKKNFSEFDDSRPLSEQVNLSESALKSFSEFQKLYADIQANLNGKLLPDQITLLKQLDIKSAELGKQFGKLWDDNSSFEDRIKTADKAVKSISEYQDTYAALEKNINGKILPEQIALLKEVASESKRLEIDFGDKNWAEKLKSAGANIFGIYEHIKKFNQLKKVFPDIEKADFEETLKLTESLEGQLEELKKQYGGQIEISKDAVKNFSDFQKMYSGISGELNSQILPEQIKLIKELDSQASNLKNELGNIWIDNKPFEDQIKTVDKAIAYHHVYNDLGRELNREILPEQILIMRKIGWETENLSGDFVKFWDTASESAKDEIKDFSDYMDNTDISATVDFRGKINPEGPLPQIRKIAEKEIDKFTDHVEDANPELHTVFDIHKNMSMWEKWSDFVLFSTDNTVKYISDSFKKIGPITEKYVAKPFDTFFFNLTTQILKITDSFKKGAKEASDYLEPITEGFENKSSFEQMSGDLLKWLSSIKLFDTLAMDLGHSFEWSLGMIQLWYRKTMRLIIDLSTLFGDLLDFNPESFHNFIIDIDGWIGSLFTDLDKKLEGLKNIPGRIFNAILNPLTNMWIKIQSSFEPPDTKVLTGEAKKAAEELQKAAEKSASLTGKVSAEIKKQSVDMQKVVAQSRKEISEFEKDTEKVMSVIDKPFEAVALGIIKTSENIESLWDKWSDFVLFSTENTVKQIEDLWGSWSDFVLFSTENTVKWFNDIFKKINTFLEPIVLKMIEPFDNLFNKITKKIINFSDVIKDHFNELVKVYMEIQDKLPPIFKDFLGIEKSVENTSEASKKMAENIENTLTKMNEIMNESFDTEKARGNIKAIITDAKEAQNVFSEMFGTKDAQAAEYQISFTDKETGQQVEKRINNIADAGDILKQHFEGNAPEIKIDVKGKDGSVLKTYTENEINKAIATADIKKPPEIKDWLIKVNADQAKKDIKDIFQLFEGEQNQSFNNINQSLESAKDGIIDMLGNGTDEIDKMVLSMRDQFRSLFDPNKLAGEDTGRTTVKGMTEGIYQLYEQFYNKLDARRKISFEKFWADTESEVKTYEDAAVKHGISEEQRMADIERIRREAFEKFKQIAAQEIDTTHAESLKKTVSDIAEYTSLMDQESQRRVESMQTELDAIDRYQQEQELLAAKGLENNDTMIQAKADFTESLRKSAGDLGEVSQQEIDVITKADMEKAALFQGMYQIQESVAQKQRKLQVAMIDEEVGNLQKKFEFSLSMLDAYEKREIASITKAVGDKKHLNDLEVQHTQSRLSSEEKSNLELILEKEKFWKKNLSLQQENIDAANQILSDPKRSEAEKQLAEQTLKSIKERNEEGLKLEKEAVDARKKLGETTVANHKQSNSIQQQADAELLIEKQKFFKKNLEFQKANIDEANKIIADPKRSEAEKKAAEQTLKSIKERNEEILALEKNTLNEKIKLQNEEVTAAKAASKEKQRAEKAVNNEVKAINRQTIKERIKLYNDYITGLKAKLNEYRDKEKTVASEILAIQEKINDSRKTAEQIVSDLRRKNMSEEQQYNDKWREVEELRAKAAITMQTDHEKGNQLYQDAIQLAASLGEEIKNNEQVVVSQYSASERAIKAVTDMQKEQEDALLSSQDSRQAEQDDLREKSEETAEQIQGVSEELKALKEQDKSLKIETNSPEVIAEIEQIQGALDKIKDKTVTVTVVKKESSETAMNEGGRVKYATGGPVFGTPGIDNIPAWLTHNEFVQPVPSVFQYGLDFMEGIRKRIFPVENIKLILAAGTKRLRKIFAQNENKYYNGGYVWKPPFVSVPSVSSIVKNITVNRYSEGGLAKGMTMADLQSFGNFTLSDPNTGAKIKAMAPAIDLQQFGRAVKQDQRLRYNPS